MEKMDYRSLIMEAQTGINLGIIGTLVGSALTYEAVKNFKEYSAYQSETNTGTTFGIPNGSISLGISGTLTLAGLALAVSSFFCLRKLKKTGSKFSNF